MVRFEATAPLMGNEQIVIDTALEMGLQKKIKMYVASTRFELQLVPLYTGQIQHLKYKYPSKTFLRIDGDPNDLYPLAQFADHLVSTGKAIEVSIEDLRIEKSVLDEIISESTTRKHKTNSSSIEQTNSAILGSLIELILDKTPQGNPISVYNSSEAIVNALEARFKIEHGLRGFGERTLSGKFSQAKKELQRLKDSIHK